jgi:hypothetical protein
MVTKVEPCASVDASSSSSDIESTSLPFIHQHTLASVVVVLLIMLLLYQVLVSFAESERILACS